MTEKGLLKKLGEETLFSAKGHFKACDIRRNQITITIWMCALLNIVGMFDFPSLWAKIISGFGLFGTVALIRRFESVSFSDRVPKVKCRDLARKSEI